MCSARLGAGRQGARQCRARGVAPARPWGRGAASSRDRLVSPFHDRWEGLTTGSNLQDSHLGESPTQTTRGNKGVYGLLRLERGR